MKITIQLSEAEIIEAIYQQIINNAASVGEPAKIELQRDPETGEFVANVYFSEDLV